MSYLVTAPEYVSAAAMDLAGIGSMISAANASAAGPTTAMVAAGADEVSVAVSAVFSEYGRAYRALSAQVEAFHGQFVQLVNAAGGTYAAAEAANIASVQTVQQEVAAVFNAPAQLGGALAGANLGGLTSGLANVAGLGNAAGFGSLTGPTGGGGLTNLGGLGNLGGLTAGLTNLNIGGNLGRLANVPYNLFADVANIPYYESLALQEYAYALGPAGSVGGVPGWIPSGTAPSAIATVNGLHYYALGGTGSWEMQSLGNTWGWDDGNWPQVDAILHFVLPFPFTESLANQVQTLAQAEFIDGSTVGTEFQAANPLAYLGQWVHGDTSLQSLLAGTHYPNIIEDTIGANVIPGQPNLASSGSGVVTLADGQLAQNVAWSGQYAQLQPLAPLQAIGANLTGPPSANPIQLPNLGNVASNAIKLGADMSYDFDPFETGSFLYWGAPTCYSVPAALGGTLQDFTGIPNQFPLANLGAEPVWGYGTGPSFLPTGLQEGGAYLEQGLLGYTNPGIYVQALSNDVSALTAPPSSLLAGAPLVGYLGID